MLASDLDTMPCLNKWYCVRICLLEKVSEKLGVNPGTKWGWDGVDKPWDVFMYNLKRNNNFSKNGKLRHLPYYRAENYWGVQPKDIASECHRTLTEACKR